MSTPTPPPPATTTPTSTFTRTFTLQRLPVLEDHTETPEVKYHNCYVSSPLPSAEGQRQGAGTTTTYMPYRSPPATIYGETKLCVILRQNSHESFYRVVRPVQRFCVKITYLRRLADARAYAARSGGHRFEDPYRELSILRALNVHRNVNQLIEAGETVAQIPDNRRGVSRALFVVLGCCDVDMFDHVSAAGRFDEATARRRFLDMVRGVAHAHSRRVAHLDVSLENTMIRHADDAAVIIDFGAAHYFPPGTQPPNDRFRMIFGKYMYMHPSMFRRYVGRRFPTSGVGAPAPAFTSWSMSESDVWSLGVCLFIMVVGGPPWDVPYTRPDFGRAIPPGTQPPFQARLPSAAPPRLTRMAQWLDREGRFREIAERGRLRELLRDWDTPISAQCADLLQQMLRAPWSQGARIVSIVEIMRHPWIAAVAGLRTGGGGGGGGNVGGGNGATKSDEAAGGAGGGASAGMDVE